MAKEAYSRGKRGLFMWQKRPIDVGTPEVRAMEGVDERGALRYVYAFNLIVCQVVCAFFF